MSGISESAAWCKRHAGKLLAGAALVISPAVWSQPAGAQVPTCLGLPANIIGTTGHDVLNGTPCPPYGSNGRSAWRAADAR